MAATVSIIDMAFDIMADMVNADCVHIRWLVVLCGALVLFVHTGELFTGKE